MGYFGSALDNNTDLLYFASYYFGSAILFGGTMSERHKRNLIWMVIFAAIGTSVLGSCLTVIYILFWFAKYLGIAL